MPVGQGVGGAVEVRVVDWKLKEDKWWNRRGKLEFIEMDL